MINEMIDGMIVDWLEELPLDELPTDYARMIVNQFREGHMEVTEAISLLQEDCSDDLSDCVKQNLELNKLLE
jgi:hypothetical protein